MELDPALVEPQLSTRLTGQILAIIEQRFGLDKLDLVLRDVGLPRSYLEAGDNWLSCAAMSRLAEAVAIRLFHLTSSPQRNHPMWELFREAGRRTMTSRNFGPLWILMKNASSPRVIYKTIPRVSTTINRVVDFKLTGESRGQARFECSSRNLEESPGACASRIGVLESIPPLWLLPYAEIEHPRCMHDPENPAPCCEYLVTYKHHAPRIMPFILSGGLGLALGLFGARFSDQGLSLLESLLLATSSLGLGGWWFQVSQTRRKDDSQLYLEQLVETHENRLNALIASEQRFNQLVENIPQVFFISSPDRQHYDYISPACRRLFGIDCNALEKTPEIWLDTILPDDRAAVREHWRRSTAEARELSYRLLGPDGRTLYVKEILVPVKTSRDEEPRIAGLVEDITAAMEARLELDFRERQLQQSRKMEAIGRLAGGIAHDFNNLLTGIMGNAELALMDEPEPSVAEGIQEILNAGERAMGLTRQLLAFSRREVVAPRVLDLGELLTSLNRMLTMLIGEHIKLETRVPEHQVRILADPTQIEQVITNLVVNSRDAMPEGGTIVVEIREHRQEHSSEQRSLPSGAYARLTVSDTGTGMDEETRARIFEPFFTTKAKNKGTGLGLATVFGIVRQASGFIEVLSEPGKGTVFTIHLPLVFDAVSPSPKSREERSTRGTESILVVEDEDMVRDISVKILRNHGYRVLSARSGDEAVELVRRSKPSLDLLLTDLVMPGIGGRKAAELITRDCPGVKVLFMSGYTDDQIVRQAVEERAAHFLSKPFHPDTLAKKIREILDSEGPHN